MTKENKKESNDICINKFSPSFLHSLISTYFTVLNWAILTWNFCTTSKTLRLLLQDYYSSEKEDTGSEVATFPRVCIGRWLAMCMLPHIFSSFFFSLSVVKFRELTVTNVPNISESTMLLTLYRYWRPWVHK